MRRKAARQSLILLISFIYGSDAVLASKTRLSRTPKTPKKKRSSRPRTFELGPRGIDGMSVPSSFGNNNGFGFLSFHLKEARATKKKLRKLQAETGSQGKEKLGAIQRLYRSGYRLSRFGSSLNWLGALTLVSPFIQSTGYSLHEAFSLVPTFGYSPKLFLASASFFALGVAPKIFGVLKLSDADTKLKSLER